MSLQEVWIEPPNAIMATPIRRVHADPRETGRRSRFIARPVRASTLAAKTHPLNGLPNAKARAATDTSGIPVRRRAVRGDGRHPLVRAITAMAITMCHATATPVAWFAMADSPSRISVALGIDLCHAACEIR
jgi:hypothetical protein